MTDEEFTELYERSARRLVGVAYAACGSMPEAQDCVQEAFVRAWTRRTRLDPAKDPEAWLRVTTVRLAVSRWRRLRTFDHAMARSGPDHSTAPPDGHRIDVARALQSLSAVTRTVVVLHYVADLPVQQIADQTGIPLNTVKSHLSRGRATLRSVLGPNSSSKEHNHV